MSRGITLYLHAHQPWRVRQYSIFDVASRHDYFHSARPEQNNQRIFNRTSDASYIPMNRLLERLLTQHPEFCLSLSLSGTFLEQAEQFNPVVLQSFQRLIATGRVELVASPYYHSLAFFHSRSEFEAQIRQQRQIARRLFGLNAKLSVLANTDLIYDDALATWAESAGFRGVLAGGRDMMLEGYNPNYCYQAAGTKQLGVLIKHARLSDDIALRFGDWTWDNWPLDAKRYRQWLVEAMADAPLVNLCMNYEVFGEHQRAESGIFDFLEALVQGWLQTPNHHFYTVSEAIKAHPPTDELSLPRAASWVSGEHDIESWSENALQREALHYLYELEADIVRSGDEKLIHDWRCLQASDHFHYMRTTGLADSHIHLRFSPYESPYDAFLYYMNAIRDLRWRLSAARYGVL